LTGYKREVRLPVHDEFAKCLGLAHFKRLCLKSSHNHPALVLPVRHQRIMRTLAGREARVLAQVTVG